MKILGIMGSPRKGGNTDILMDEALDEAHSGGAIVEKIVLQDKIIAPCSGCLQCTESGKCVIMDDMDEIYDKMLESDGIIWATPVYFWSMTAQTKTAMDRNYALTYPTLQLANKVGGLITVANSRGCVNTSNIFHSYFSYNHMFFAEFASGYATRKGEVKHNTFAMNAASEMARQMIGLIQADLRYPEEFDTPMPRLVRNKYSL